MYFKTLSKNFLIIFIIILLNKCDDHNKFETIQKSNISIQFDPIKIDNINENDFFIIDSIKIIHTKKKPKEFNKNELFIPTPRYSLGKIEKKEFLNKTNNIDLAIRIYEHLKLHKKKYQVTNLSSIFSIGLINIRRNDGKKIIVKKKIEYPLLINN